jgi:hypothetical protein
LSSMFNEVYILIKNILHVFLFTWVGGMIFKTTFNNISVISWRLVLLVAFIHRMWYLIITHLSRTSIKKKIRVLFRLNPLVYGNSKSYNKYVRTHRTDFFRYIGFGSSFGLAFLHVSNACTNKLYIFRQYILHL